MKAGIAAAAFGLVAAEEQAYRGHGYKSSEPYLPRTLIEGAVSADAFVSDDALPKSFDWRDVNGKSFVVQDWNQHIPQYCGSCWIHGTLSALNDRIKVLRGAKFPDVVLGRQSIMNCVPAADGKGDPPGCNGGDAWMIHKYMHENKVPDETCMPYQAKNMGCSAENVCRNCYPDETGKGCFAVDKFVGYGVHTYGNLSGEAAMKKEIYARGPIACSFATDMDFLNNFSDNAVQHEGVFVATKTYNSSQVDHVMEVAGWGETPSGLPYWVIRNSWGTYWGEGGWLKLHRGANDLLGESTCDWAVPSVEGLDEVLQNKVMGSYAMGLRQVAAFTSEAAAVAPADISEAAALDRSATHQGSYFMLGVGTFAAGVAMTMLVVKVVGGKTRVGQAPLLG